MPEVEELPEVPPGTIAYDSMMLRRASADLWEAMKTHPMGGRLVRAVDRYLFRRGSTDA